MLLSPTMSLEDKIDEIYDLPTEDLEELLEDFQKVENYENCQAINTVLDERKTKLANVVLYQHQKFITLKDPAAILTLMQAFKKLKPLEDEICKYFEATIDFLESGNLMVTGMPDSLNKKVTALLVEISN